MIMNDIWLILWLFMALYQLQLLSSAEWGERVMRIKHWIEGRRLFYGCHGIFLKVLSKTTYCLAILFKLQKLG
jgi:hypothetical protein